MKLESWKRFKKSWQLQIIFLLPLVYLIVFKYVPMYGAQIAFRNFNAIDGIWGSKWIGWHYFDRFFHSYDFYNVLWNTLGLALYHVIATFPFPILLALSLNQVHSGRFRKAVQTITYAPHFISVVVMVGIIMEMLDPRTGLVNKILQLAGLNAVHFMALPGWFQSIYVWSDVWQHVGWNSIIFLAALAGIDPTLHEAAIMDGASKWRRVWHIDMPGIMPVAVILLVLNSGHIMDLGFEKALLLQNPLNMGVSEIIDTYVYHVGLASNLVNFSYATAIGLFKSIINLVLLLLLNTVARRAGQESLW